MGLAGSGAQDGSELSEGRTSRGLAAPAVRAPQAPPAAAPPSKKKEVNKVKIAHPNAKDRILLCFCYVLVFLCARCAFGDVWFGWRLSRCEQRTAGSGVIENKLTMTSMMMMGLALRMVTWMWEMRLLVCFCVGNSEVADMVFVLVMQPGGAQAALPGRRHVVILVVDAAVSSQYYRSSSKQLQ